jgi:hypothetical protein
MTDQYCDTGSTHTIQNWQISQITSRHMVTHFGENRSECTHSGPGNADHMNASSL